MLNRAHVIFHLKCVDYNIMQVTLQECGSYRRLIFAFFVAGEKCTNSQPVFHTFKKFPISKF